MANEFANQYGINLGAIDNAVSNKKTAELRLNALKRQDTKEIASDKAEQDYMKDPATAVASTIAQKLQWNTLNASERADKAAAMKEQINQRGITINNIIGIQDPVQQKAALQQTVSQMPPEEQAQFSQKYGATPDDWQKNLPHVMNDLLVADGGVKLLEKQAELKTKHAYDLDLVKAKGESEAGIRASQNAFTSKENALNREATSENVLARVQAGDSNKESINELRKQTLELAKQKVQDAEEARKEKQQTDRAKNVEKIVDNIPNFNGLSSDEQKEAKQIYIETGKFPDIEKLSGAWAKVPFTDTAKIKKSNSSSTARPPLSQF